LKRRARAACALAWLAVAACATTEGGPPFRPVSGEDEVLHQRFAAVQAAARERRTLRALGKLRLASPDGSTSVQEVVLAERPAQLRLESLNMLGQAATLLVTDGARFTFFDGKQLASGALTEGVLREHLGLAFEPAEAVRALLAAPLAVDWRPTEILGRGDERLVRLPSESVRFSASGDLAAISGLDARGGVRWLAEYSDWRDVPGGRYPFDLVLSFPETKLRAELVLSEAELNPTLDPALFRVERGAAP
jgi:hypothetical protein